MSSFEGRHVRENHKDYNQVVLDVRRSMKRFPKGACLYTLISLVPFIYGIVLPHLKRECICVLGKI